jgi:hypothetical protein
LYPPAVAAKGAAKKAAATTSVVICFIFPFLLMRTCGHVAWYKLSHPTVITFRISVDCAMKKIDGPDFGFVVFERHNMGRLFDGRQISDSAA